MLRGVILIVLLFLGAVLVLPFIASSLYIDQRGTTIPGHVYSKREDVTVDESSLKYKSEVTIEYAKPDGSGDSFFGVELSPAEYDAMHLGETVSLHYLRQEDVPDLPLSRFLRRAQLLPMVRLANQQAFSNVRLVFTRQVTTVTAAVCVVLILLLIWRITRVPGFGIAVGLCVLVGGLAVYVYDFPRPLPAPMRGVREGVGRVKSIAQIDALFTGPHSKGVMAGQPIQVVGIEFIPEGRTESVLAVDLIDAGSAPALREKSSVVVVYESLSPRTAYIRGASRTFVSRNIAGIVEQGIACLMVLVVVWVGAKVLGRAYRRLTRQPSSST